MAERNDMGDVFAYMLTAKRTVLGVDAASGDDCTAEVEAVTRPDGRLEILAVRHVPCPPPLTIPEGLVTRHRPRTPAGVATMAELMRRSRVERDFGGVEDE